MAEKFSLSARMEEQIGEPTSSSSPTPSNKAKKRAIQKKGGRAKKKKNPNPKPSATDAVNRQEDDVPPTRASDVLLSIISSVSERCPRRSRKEPTPPKEVEIRQAVTTGSGNDSSGKSTQAPKQTRGRAEHDVN